jgi:energy-coupling factor transporter transmembrane protein EcfT
VDKNTNKLLKKGDIFWSLFFLIYIFQQKNFCIIRNHYLILRTKKRALSLKSLNNIDISLKKINDLNRKEVN